MPADKLLVFLSSVTRRIPSLYQLATLTHPIDVIFCKYMVIIIVSVLINDFAVPEQETVVPLMLKEADNLVRSTYLIFRSSVVISLPSAYDVVNEAKINMSANKRIITLFTLKTSCIVF